MKTYFVTVTRTYVVKVRADNATEARDLVERGNYRSETDQTLMDSKVGRAREADKD